MQGVHDIHARSGAAAAGMQKVKFAAIATQMRNTYLRSYCELMIFLFYMGEEFLSWVYEVLQKLLLSKVTKYF